MTNMNRGYVGWSMSVRAAEAYADGEMPKSKWTKKAMLTAMADYLWLEDVTLADDAMGNLENLTKDEMFQRFFYCSSWHHTSKFCNATDFYSLDEDEMARYVSRPTRREYHVRWRLGSHSLVGRDTFRSRAAAERRIKRNGFRLVSHTFMRGRFEAEIIWDEFEI